MNLKIKILVSEMVLKWSKKSPEMTQDLYYNLSKFDRILFKNGPKMTQKSRERKNGTKPFKKYKFHFMTFQSSKNLTHCAQQRQLPLDFF